MAIYFTLKELCASETAKKRNIDNFPSFEIASNLRVLTERVLDPLRIAWGSAIRVTSGYRSEALNAAIGGSKTSVHRYGFAVDLQPVNGMTDSFIKFTKEWLKDNHIAYDQLIRETKNGKLWLHFGLYGPKGQQRCQYLEINA